jgi:endo-1,4-beta-xylanase
MNKKTKAPLPSLSELAEKRRLYVCAAAAFPHLRQNPRYNAVLAQEYNMITPENTMKWPALHPEKAKYDFKDADYLVKFAQASRMLVRGHTLVWHQANPTWLVKTSFTQKQWTNILRDHINTVVRHFKGQLAYWDVVNEAIDDKPPYALRESPWLQNVGTDYIEKAFHWAHQADPEVKLFYNDYNTEGLNKKSDAVYRLAGRLLERKVPLHGIGLQMHISLEQYPPLKEVAKNIRRLGGLGLEVHITECDVRIKEPVTAKKLEEQAKIYRYLMEVCLAEQHCTAFITWGFTDAASWVPSFFKGHDQALPFDRAYHKKPAYEALIEALKKGTPKK